MGGQAGSVGREEPCILLRWRSPQPHPRLPLGGLLTVRWKKQEGGSPWVNAAGKPGRPQGGQEGLSEGRPGEWVGLGGDGRGAEMGLLGPPCRRGS